MNLNLANTNLGALKPNLFLYFLAIQSSCEGFSRTLISLISILSYLQALLLEIYLLLLLFGIFMKVSCYLKTLTSSFLA